MSPQLNVMSETRPTNHLATEDGTGDWREQSACDELTAHLFHGPSRKESDQARTDRITAALTICATCPVRDACLQDAVDTRDTWGIRGGLTGEQIQSTIRRRTRKAGA